VIYEVTESADGMSCLLASQIRGNGAIVALTPLKIIYINSRKPGNKSTL
jgi:hypothetical protein